jgi:hypothetical protein
MRAMKRECSGRSVTFAMTTGDDDLQNFSLNKRQFMPNFTGFKSYSALGN